MDSANILQHARARRVTPPAPESSLLLLKPTAELPHEGGRQLEETSPAYAILKRWIAEGVPGPEGDAGRVERLEIVPNRVDLKAGASTRLQVRAHWSDGMVQEVTDWTLYEAKEERIAEVSENGTVTAKNPGRTAVTLSYLGKVEAVTVSVPFEDVAAADAPPFQPRNFIDEMLMAEWARMGLKPAPAADDYEFLRRLYVDLIGTLPKPEEIRAFVANADPEKRAKLVDTLLERPEYVDVWTLKWGDLLRVHRRFLGDKGMWSFHDWLAQAIRENRGVDKIVNEILTARGDLYTNGAVGYFFVDEEPEQLAETTAQVFLGMRMQCARCHHHPNETWTQEDYFGLANYFSRIEKKENGDGGRYGGARVIRAADKVVKEMRPKMIVDPHAFGAAVVKDGEAAGDVRQRLADWVTNPENTYFAQNWTNRYWSYFMGRGLVEPVDDLRATNPAAIPELLNRLSDEFVKNGFDVKHLIRLICTSQAYGLASEVAPDQDVEGKFHTYRKMQRLQAQVLADAVDQATGVPEVYEGMPPGTRAISLPDPGVKSDFLNMFGRSTRANPCECATTTNPDLAQALFLINSDMIQAKVGNSAGRLQKLLTGEKKGDDAAILTELYLWTLSRPPSAAEMAVLQAQIAGAPNREEAYQDLLWSLLNSGRFVFNH